MPSWRVHCFTPLASYLVIKRSSLPALVWPSSRYDRIQQPFTQLYQVGNNIAAAGRLIRQK